MNKQLINLIKSSKLVIITGTIGSGKSLLLTKLAHHSQLAGKIITKQEQLNFSENQANIFIDEIFLNESNYQRIIFNQQRLIFCSTRFQQLLINIREQADLIIQIQGIKTYWWTGNKYLQLTVSRFSSFNSDPYFLEIPLNKEDFTRLEKYQQENTKNSPLWLNTQEFDWEKLLRERKELMKKSSG